MVVVQRNCQIAAELSVWSGGFAVPLAVVLPLPEVATLGIALVLSANADMVTAYLALAVVQGQLPSCLCCCPGRTKWRRGSWAKAQAAGTARAMIGGALVWLVGIGGLTIPGLGRFIVAGQIMAALAGAGAYGAAGGFAGSLVSRGVPECKREDRKGVYGVER